MASRKKDPAALRTLDMFSGKTVLEEAEDKLAQEAIEEEERSARSYSDPTAMAEHAEECAIRWLGLDAFHEGDDIKLAVHRSGHAVVVLVDTSGPNRAAHSTRTFKLSRAQWTKLRQLVKEADGRGAKASKEAPANPAAGEEGEAG